ncbi:hypothetical protein [Spirosoma jeollabukense]
MKKIATAFIVLMLAGYGSVRAQSGSVSKGQTGAGPTNYARKANSSQTLGKSADNPQDKDQQQRRTEAKGGTPAASGSSAGSHSSTSGQGGARSNQKSSPKTKRASS